MKMLCIQLCASANSGEKYSAGEGGKRKMRRMPIHMHKKGSGPELLLLVAALRSKDKREKDLARGRGAVGKRQ